MKKNLIIIGYFVGLTLLGLIAMYSVEFIKMGKTDVSYKSVSKTLSNADHIILIFAGINTPGILQ